MHPVECGAEAGHLPEPALGNYFVANYPPFSVWTESAVKDYRKVLDVPWDATASPELGLYVHVPFCIERCHYCYYHSRESDPGEVDAYLEALIAEIDAYGKLPALAGRPLAFAYVGGGTPSVLSAGRARRLMKAIGRAFPLGGAREISFECAPRSATESLLDALIAVGVTRVSLGVQQMNDEVLTANGRIHLVSDVRRAFDAIRHHGFDVVNIDLIAGLVGQTDESFMTSLDDVIELAPESVTIYQLEIPLNTPLSRSIRDGTVEPKPADWDEKRERLRRGLERLEGAGYVVRSGYTAVRDPERHSFVYQDAQYHGADLLGVGASAFSHIAGIDHQNLAAVGAYTETLRQGNLPMWRAYVLSERELLTRELVLQLKLGALDRVYFRRKFGVDVVDELRSELRELEQSGWLDIQRDTIEVTREGLLRVDRLLPALYLPEHRGVRYS